MKITNEIYIYLNTENVNTSSQDTFTFVLPAYFEFDSNDYWEMALVEIAHPLFALTTGEQSDCFILCDKIKYSAVDFNNSQVLRCNFIPEALIKSASVEGVIGDNPSQQ